MVYSLIILKLLAVEPDDHAQVLHTLSIS